MKTTKILLTLFVIGLSFYSATAQPQTFDNMVTIQTTDGPIAVKGNTLSFRDYSLIAVGNDREEKIELKDFRTGTTATLDLRDDEGIYLIVVEDSKEMQVVAPWKKVQLQSRQIHADAPREVKKVVITNMLNSARGITAKSK